MNYRLFKDGNMWCAVGPHFICIATDPAGFGETKDLAVAALLADRSFQTWLGKNAPPQISRFKLEDLTGMMLDENGNRSIFDDVDE